MKPTMTVEEAIEVINNSRNYEYIKLHDGSHGVKDLKNAWIVMTMIPEKFAEEQLIEFARKLKLKAFA